MLCLPAQAASPLDDLIKPEQGSSACFTRVYEAAHLRAHPRQKTAAMTVWLKYEPIGGGVQGIALNVALGITQRGDTAAQFSEGGCEFNDRANRDTSNNHLIKTYPKEAGHVCLQSARPDVFDSVSAEEGGSLILDRGKDRDTLMVYLERQPDYGEAGQPQQAAQHEVRHGRSRVPAAPDRYEGLCGG